MIAKHGGRFLVRGGAVESLEGPTFGDRMVVVDFPPMEAAKAMYTSPEYQAAAIHHHASSEATFLLSEGAPEDDAPDANVTIST